MNEDADAVLVEDCRKGDRQAFETLLARYRRPVYNAAFRILNDPEDARDVTQTVFLKAFENLDRFDPKYRFFSWIYRIAINESINLLKKQGRVDPIDHEPVSEDRGPAETVRDNELGRGVQVALMTLNTEYRTVLVLKHFLGCSYREISHILEIPEKTVKSRLFTARQLLRDRLVSTGIVGG